MLCSPREPALRKARICYDYLAGGMGVAVYEALIRHRAIAMTENGLRLIALGDEWFARVGVDTNAAARQPRIFCRPCMDWSERRYHLAGSLGAAFLARCRELGWRKIERNSRVVRITSVDRGLRSLLLRLSTEKISKLASEVMFLRIAAMSRPHWRSRTE
jgi:hypothetical protein